MYPLPPPQSPQSPPAQLSPLERELLPSLPPKPPSLPPSQRPALQGAELDAAMRRVWVGWQRWHRCERFEQAVADPLTRRLLAMAANRGPLRRGAEF